MSYDEDELDSDLDLDEEGNASEDDNIVCPFCGETAWMMDDHYVCDVCGDVEDE